MKQKMAGAITIFTFVIFLLAPAGSVHAASAGEIDARVKDALETLYRQVVGSKDTLKRAKGVLVIPKMWKAGFVVGGEYGEGALKIKGKTVNYYSIVGGSLGFQLGVQKRTIVMAFMDKTSFSKFRQTDGWEFGLDGSVAIVNVGVDGRIDSTTTNEPIIVFVFGQKGLMYNLTLEGYKISKIVK